MPRPSQHLIEEEPLSVPQLRQHMNMSMEEPMSVPQPSQHVNLSVEELPSVPQPSQHMILNLFRTDKVKYGGSTLPKNQSFV